MANHKAHLIGLQRELAKQSLLVEAGWIMLRVAGFGEDTTPEQLRDLRMAFFAGAHHLFGAIMAIMDSGTEPTDADMARMDRISAELLAFENQLKLRIAGTTSH
jgi:hypothetical protein